LICIQPLEEPEMSQVHLVDHLDAAKKLAILSEQPFVAYLIQMAKDASCEIRLPTGTGCAAKVTPSGA
jgi:hypothetical protein